MEFLTDISSIFFCLAMLLLLLCLFYSGRRKKIVSELKPIQYISFKKEHFNKDFDFVCEFCGTTISTKQDKCSGCGGAYGKNKEYKAKKQAMNQNYLNYLKTQGEKLEQEMDYIEKTKEFLRKNRIWKNSIFNFELGEPPIYKPATDYHFICSYCDNKLQGKSTDEKGCDYCGASYKNNLELLVREEEDKLEKHHYEEYFRLKEIEWLQNVENEQKDAYIEQKYSKQISFLKKNAKFIAMTVVFGMLLLAMGIFALLNRLN